MTVALVRPAAFRIGLAGQPLPPLLARALSGLLIRQALAASTAAELDFANPDSTADAALSVGATLKIEAGDGTLLFDGEIVSREHEHDGAHGRVLRLRAYDRLNRLRRNRRTRAMAKTSAASLASELAGEIGCAALAQREPPERELVIQSGESDFDLLADLAGASGLYPYLDGGTLRLAGLEGEGDAVKLTLGANLISVRATLSAERALTRGEAGGWNLANSDRIRGEAPLACQDQFEFRDIGLPQPSERLIHGLLADGEPEAKARAEADMDRAAAHQAVITGAAAGDAALKPGTPVEIAGLAAEACGRYVLTEVLHRFDASVGYRCEISTAPPARPARPRDTFFALGEVSDTADPEGMGRAKVKLPSFAGVETSWMQVVVAGAGPGKGLAALPETGDDVLVVFPDADPARGIVLGGLYGRKRLPRGVGRKKARPFVLRTGGGQTLELAAEGAYARLSTSAGSLVELAHNNMRVAAATDLVIEAPGKTITIRASAVNFERG